MDMITCQNSWAKIAQSDSWTQRYQRNNKRTGLKNLRCFPYCSDDHKARGFCGRPVTIHMSLSPTDSVSDYMFYGEFVKADSTTNAEYSSIKLHQAIAKERTKKDPFNPWYKGDVTDTSSIPNIAVVEFNRQKKGWHYGWVSNKHSCDLEHLFRAYVFKKVSNDETFDLLMSVNSPTFTLFCRRRQRDLVPNLPQQLRKQVKLTSSSLRPLLPDGSQSSSEMVAAKSLMKMSTKKKMTSKQRKAEKIIWKVIKALLAVEQKQVQESTNLLFCKDCGPSQINPPSVTSTGEKGVCCICKVPLGSPSVTSPVTETNLLSLPSSEEKVETNSIVDSKTLTEYLDSFLPEFNDIGSLPSEEIGLPDYEAPLDLDYTFGVFDDFTSQQEVTLDRNSVLEELGKFLINEKSLTTALNKLLMNKSSQLKSFTKRKSLVLAVFAEQIQIFLTKFGIGLNQLNEMLSETAVSAKTQKSNDFEQFTNSEEVRAYLAPPETEPISSLTIDQKYEVLLELQRILEGDFVYDERLSHIHELIRKDVGIPWIVRKVMGSAERNYSNRFLNVDKESILAGKVKLETTVKSKLLDSGKKVYTFDSKNYSSNFKWPIPVKKAELKKNFLPSTRGYIDYDRKTIVVFHLYGNLHRTVRHLSLQRDHTTVESIYAYQRRKHETENWNNVFVLTSKRLPAVSVKPEISEGFSDLPGSLVDIPR